MRARIFVTLKKAVLDPQGKAIETALQSLQIEGIEHVRQGKLFDISLSSQDRKKAEEALQQACTKLLSNDVIEEYQIEFEE